MTAGTPLAVLLACVAGGYLLGSIPFGLLVTRSAGVGDIRAIGSGNIGATNVLRTGRRDLAVATLVGDAAKGALAVLLARALAGDVAGDLAGAAAFLGHLFPVWLRFRGGKGVATFFGVLLAVAWPAGVGACAVWLLTAALLRYSSLAALFASAIAPSLVLLSHRPRAAMWTASLMAAFIFLRHRANIARLRAGTEPQIASRSAPPL